MTTLVVDWHGRLADLERAMPFLYPLLRTGRLRMLSLGAPPDPGEGASHADAIRLDVLRAASPGGEWQLVVLFDLTTGDRMLPAGSLVERLATLRCEVLDRLAARHLHPRHVWAVVVDPLERASHTGAPLDEAASRRWALDATGFIDDNSDAPYLFAMLDFTTLQRAWDSGGERSLDARYRRTLEAGRALIKKRRDAVEEARITSCLLTPDRYDQTNDRFADLLEQAAFRLDAKPDTYDPSDTLRSVLRSQFSLFAFTADMFVVRFPMRGRQQSAFQRTQLDLAYTLGVLENENVGAAFRQKRERAIPMPVHRVAEVCLEEQRMPVLLDRYGARLKNEAARLEAGLSSRQSVKLPVYRDGHCNCPGGAPRRDLEAPSFGWFRRHDDLKRWEDWQAQTRAVLDEAQRDGHTIVAGCLENTHRDPPEELVEANDLRAEVEARRELSKKTRQRLIQQSYPKAFAFSFDDALITVNRQVRHQIEMRNRPQRFWVCWGIGLVVLFLPWAFLLKAAPSGWDYALEPVLLIGLALVAAVATLATIARRLRKALREGHALAAGIALNIERTLEQKREYVARLCKATVARRNVEAAEHAARSRQRRVLRETFHRNQMRLHAEKARELRRLWPASEPAEPIRAVEDLSFDDRQFLLDNAVYVPATFHDDPDEVYSVLLGSASIRHEGTPLPGLDRLAFEEDAVLMGAQVKARPGG